MENTVFSMEIIQLVIGITLFIIVVISRLRVKRIYSLSKEELKFEDIRSVIVDLKSNKEPCLLYTSDAADD